MADAVLGPPDLRHTAPAAVPSVPHQGVGISGSVSLGAGGHAGAGAPAAPAAGQALWLSFLIIFVSEIGDKTFMIAAVMAMRHARWTIFSASAGALALMTLLSAILGHALPNLVSRSVTTFLAGVLFLVFGVRMLQEGRAMTGNEAKEELEEVTREIGEKEASIKAELAEGGLAMTRESTMSSLLGNGTRGATSSSSTAGGSGAGDLSPSKPGAAFHAFASKTAGPSNFGALARALHLFVSPVWVQTFVMVFLAEWGDRSQIATIALASAHGLWTVTIGATIGHCLCTGLAVMGGRLLASRISVRSVTLAGGVLFLIFGMLSLYEVLSERRAHVGHSGGDVAGSDARGSADGI